MVTELVEPEFTENKPDEQAKPDQEIDVNAENSYYYSELVLYVPMALLETAAVGPQLPKALKLDPKLQ